MWLKLSQFLEVNFEDMKKSILKYRGDHHNWDKEDWRSESPELSQKHKQSTEWAWFQPTQSSEEKIDFAGKDLEKKTLSKTNKILTSNLLSIHALKE